MLFTLEKKAGKGGATFLNPGSPSGNVLQPIGSLDRPNRGILSRIAGATRGLTGGKR